MMEPLPPRFNAARYCLAANARERPGDTALIVAGAGGREERWSFAEIDDAVRRLAGGLRGLGLPPGARVMIRMGNDSDYALTFFAAMAAGLVALPSSPQLTDAEARFLLEDSGAAALVLGDGEGDGLRAPDGVLVLESERLAALKRAEPVADFADTAVDDPAWLLYTSGTTGRPKGVLHGHRTAWGRRPMHAGWLGLRQGDVVLHAGAFNWSYTLGVGLMDPWARGATAVLYNGPRDVQIWPALMARYRTTIFAAVPSLYRQILKYCDLKAHDLSALRHGATAGEALPPPLLDAWRQATGRELYEALGMTEISTYISSGPDVPVRPGSPGRPQAGRRVAILPVDGGETPLPPEETGLLAVHRSDPGLMLGYWNRPEEDALVWRGDWFTGGDLAAIDSDGYVWYHGRNDDIMNAMGYRVSPVEVEGALSRHPDVAEVAVAELKLRDDLAVVAAFVVARDGARPDAAGLLAFAERELAAYKRPREVVFVDRLPRTANGKILRRQLAAEHARTPG